VLVGGGGRRVAWEGGRGEFDASLLFFLSLPFLSLIFAPQIRILTLLPLRFVRFPSLPAEQWSLSLPSYTLSQPPTLPSHPLLSPHPLALPTNPNPSFPLTFLPQWTPSSTLQPTITPSSPYPTSSSSISSPSVDKSLTPFDSPTNGRSCRVREERS